VSGKPEGGAAERGEAGTWRRGAPGPGFPVAPMTPSARILQALDMLCAGAVAAPVLPETGPERELAVRINRLNEHVAELRALAQGRQAEQPMARVGLTAPASSSLAPDGGVRPQTEAERERLRSQVQEAHKLESLGVLSAGVAHNINNVLAIIMGTASLREQATPEPSDRLAYQEIGRACARGRDVVKSMLHFATPILASHAPLELHTLIHEVRVLLENTTRNAIVIAAALVDEPLWIQGDAGSINHAILNLGLNALGAMPQGGTLSFRTAVLDDGRVEVVVQDTGHGMSPEVIAHALEPFYTTQEVGKGTGLGLSMTYGVVKAHGGSLEIVSRVGHGTAVHLSFPRIPAPAPSVAVPRPAPALGGMKVFLVDDDEDVRFLMTRMLTKAGVREVQVFAGGREVLARLPKEPLPDLVILDQNMPGLNGTQTLVRIRERYPALPILISSGQPDIEAWADFHQPRVSVISKPFTMEEIQAKLAQFARSPHPPEAPVG